MDLSNFYTPQKQLQESNDENIFQTKGWLKLKSKSSVIESFGLNKRSLSIFGQFFLQGKIFIAFSKIPSIKSFQTKNYFFYNQITDVIDNYREKQSHFMIKIENQNFHYKCDDLQQKQKWIKAFLLMKNQHKEKPQQKLELKDYYAQIKAEIEISCWGEIRQEFDFGSFVYEKNLGSLFQNNNKQILQNRILISKCTLEKQPSKTRNSLISNLIQVSNRVESKIQLQNVYMVLISRFPINNIFQSKEEDQSFMLQKQDLPDNHNYFTIYFYKFENFFDKSKAFDFIEINKKINLQEDVNNKTLVVQHDDYIYNIQLQFYWEYLAWNDAIIKILEFKEHIKEQQIIDLKYNFAKIVQKKFGNITPKIDEILKRIFVQLEKLDKNQNLENQFSLAIKEWNHFQNSLQSLKNLPEKYAIYSGTFFLDKIQKISIKIWKKNYANLTSQDIFAFSKLGYQINSSYFKWNYIVNPNPNLDTFSFKIFLNKLFQNSTKVLTQILSSFQENIYFENNIILSKSSDQIENLIFFILNHFDKIPTLQTALYLIDLSGVLLFYFLFNLRLIVGQYQLRNEVFLSLLNNKYQSLLGKIYKHIYKKLKQTVQLSQIKALFNNSFLIELIQQIENTSLKEASNNFRKKFRLTDIKDKNFLEFDYVKNFQERFNLIKVLLQQIKKKYYIDFLILDLIQEMVVTYLKSLINFSSKINKQNWIKVVEKLKQDQTKFEIYVEKKFQVDPSIYSYQFQKLINFLEIEDVDHLVVCILNIYQFYENLTYEFNLEEFLKLKIFQNKESIQYIKNYIKNIIFTKMRQTLCFQQDEEHLIKNIFVYFVFFRQSILKRIKKKYKKQFK